MNDQIPAMNQALIETQASIYRLTQRENALKLNIYELTIKQQQETSAESEEK